MILTLSHWMSGGHTGDTAGLNAEQPPDRQVVKSPAAVVAISGFETNSMMYLTRPGGILEDFLASHGIITAGNKNQQKYLIS
jgi:hypothetical protein